MSRQQFLKTISTIILLTLCFIVFLFYNEQRKEQDQSIAPAVQINDIIIPVELADTQKKHIQGLSDKKELIGGMLFLFDNKQVRNFWMKNMNFPIDIIWIGDGEIINISPDLQPEGENPKKIYSSIYPVNYVLEVNAGFCEKNNILIGDKVEIIN
ncbi:DUF192 domain-containing protein [Candidatus Parcubacteria bacterium]|nr:DUF192 domain-containing protein [Candidatus Parcubacteria bacterium]